MGKLAKQNKNGFANFFPVFFVLLFYWQNFSWSTFAKLFQLSYLQNLSLQNLCIVFSYFLQFFGLPFFLFDNFFCKILVG